MRKKLDLKKLTLNGSLENLILEMAEGNPGAIRVCMQLLKNSPLGISYILELDSMNIRGPQIWVGYKDFAKENLDIFIKAIITRDLNMINIINSEMSMDDPDWKENSRQ